MDNIILLYKLNQEPIELKISDIESIYAEYSLLCVKLTNGDIEYGYMIKYKQ